MAAKPPPELRDLPALLRWLAKSHHSGAIYPMAKRIGVSPALVSQWKDGLTKYPRVDTLLRLCEAYDLDLAQVLKVLEPRRPARSSQMTAIDKQIEETVEILTKLRSALAQVDYAPDDVWSKCIGKVRRLERDLVRLEKRKPEEPPA